MPFTQAILFTQEFPQRLVRRINIHRWSPRRGHCAHADSDTHTHINNPGSGWTSLGRVFEPHRFKTQLSAVCYRYAGRSQCNRFPNKPGTFRWSTFMRNRSMIASIEKTEYEVYQSYTSASAADTTSRALKMRERTVPIGQSTNVLTVS